MTKVDDRTVEVQLKQQAVTFINGLAEYTATVVPVGYARSTGDASNQIGTGPYMLQSFTPGAESVHVKNPNYWGEGRPTSTRCRSSTSPTPPGSSTPSTPARSTPPSTSRSPR